MHDATIRELVLDFNGNKTARCGCSDKQALLIPPLTEDLVKPWMIQESGGSDAGSLAAWNADPVQVNVPGNWSEGKTDLGLTKPKSRNEGPVKTNLQAGIILLCRKGFGKSGQKPSNRADGQSDGWQTALQRYNGRSDHAGNGIRYSDNYAEAIWKRSLDGSQRVPIELP